MMYWYIAGTHARMYGIGVGIQTFYIFYGVPHHHVISDISIGTKGDTLHKLSSISWDIIVPISDIGYYKLLIGIYAGTPNMIKRPLDMIKHTRGHPSINSSSVHVQYTWE